MVPDKALGHGPALRKGHVGGVGAVCGRIVHRRIDDPHLGTVSVAHDQLVPLSRQLYDGLRRNLYLF